jgi:hypothetical protein
MSLEALLRASRAVSVSLPALLVLLLLWLSLLLLLSIPPAYHH